MFFNRNPDSERGPEEKNGPPGMEEDGDIEVRSKSNQFPLASVEL